MRSFHRSDNAGLPEIDIAPNTNSNHVYSLVFTQEVPDDWVYETWFTSTFLNGALKEAERADYTDHQNIMPSIAFHYGYAPVANYKYASISMLECDDSGAPDNGDGYHAVATVVDLLSGNIVNGSWVQVGYQIQNDTAWDPFMLTTINPGACSDISVLASGNPPLNKYFLGFLNRLDGDADEVEVAWGHALY